MLLSVVHFLPRSKIKTSHEFKQVAFFSSFFRGRVYCVSRWRLRCCRVLWGVSCRLRFDAEVFGSISENSDRQHVNHPRDQSHIRVHLDNDSGYIQRPITENQIIIDIAIGL